ncbi:MAG: DMT family transporter [Deltaproteobacteria bacterium]|nr:DMT family transporter [Deltaproteobacteria bacterium]MBM4322659.1 DMT family transporter [Deltaproteobacteria bacterium]
MSKKNPNIGHLLLMVVVLTWGANYGIVKSAFVDLPPVLFGAIRFTLCGFFVLLITFKREKGISLQKRDIGKVTWIGVLGIGIYQILWLVGLDLTSASNSALILSTTPLWGALYVHLIEKEPVTWRQYLYMLVSLFGVMLVILKPTARLHFSLDTLIGDLLSLIAALFAAVFLSAWSKPLLKIYSPLRLMGYCMAIGSLVLWLAVPFLGTPVALRQVSSNSWWALGYAILLPGIIGHVSYYGGIERLGVTRSMVYLYFIPLVAILVNYLWMGEQIFLQQILGGLLILIGVHGALRH